MKEYRLEGVKAPVYSMTEPTEEERLALIETEKMMPYCFSHYLMDLKPREVTLVGLDSTKFRTVNEWGDLGRPIMEGQPKQD